MWDYAHSGIAKYWIPFGPPAGSSLERHDGESRADYVRRVGVPAKASLIAGVARFLVDGEQVDLARRKPDHSVPSRWVSQIATSVLD